MRVCVCVCVCVRVWFLGLRTMFWRTEPDMSATSSASDWPRNGTILKGKASEDNEGWVLFDNGLWLPTHQHGNQILFKQ